MTTTPAPIDRSIYPMPMFATLHVRDLGESAAFYARLGFIVLAEIPGPDGTPVLLHLRRARYQDLLLVPGDPRPGSTTVSFAAHGEDLEALAAGAREGLAAPAGVEGPTSTPWFTTDLTATDADGNVIVLTAQDEERAAAAQSWAQEFTGEFEAPGRPS